MSPYNSVPSSTASVGGPNYDSTNRPRFVKIIIIIRALSERKLRQGQNLMQNSNPDFWINLDPDPNVCRIAPKMYWIHSLVGMNHFAKYRKNRPVTMRNAMKPFRISYSTMVREMEK